MGKYVGIFGIVVLIGYFSSRPVFKVFYDATRTKVNTLTPNSQEVMKQLKGGLSVTTYVNLLEPNYEAGLPKNMNRDKRLFRQYIRFKPEIPSI